MKRLLAPFSIVVLFLAAAPAFGQITKDAELNLFFGASKSNPKDFQIGLPQSSPPVDARFRFTHAWKGGVRFNVATKGHWGEEFFYSYEQNRAKYIRTSQANDANLPIQRHDYGISALYYVSADEDERTKPFFSFGIGGTVYKPTQGARVSAADPNLGNMPGFGTAHELTFNIGAGIKQRLTKRVAFRMDLRDLFGRYPSFSLSRQSKDPATPVFPASGTIHNVEVTGGFVFYFGKK
jgi:opacity protein-like surface antigen